MPRVCFLFKKISWKVLVRRTPPFPFAPSNGVSSPWFAISPVVVVLDFLLYPPDFARFNSVRNAGPATYQNTTEIIVSLAL